VCFVLPKYASDDLQKALLAPCYKWAWSLRGQYLGLRTILRFQKLLPACTGHTLSSATAMTAIGAVCPKLL
jgi:hypothetical protein